MRKPSGSKACAAVALAALLSASAACAAQRALTFDEVFSDRGEPAQLHLKATYTVRGQVHALELWRDRGDRLRRRTDDVLDTYVTRHAPDPELHITVLDHVRKIRTDVTRTALYRIGHASDWYSMAHGLVPPPAGSVLETAVAPPGVTAPIESCRWYTLSQGEHDSRICWSQHWRVPLLITDARGAEQWRVTQVSAEPVDAQVFAIHDAGYVKNDADNDIRGD